MSGCAHPLAAQAPSIPSGSADPSLLFRNTCIGLQSTSCTPINLMCDLSYEYTTSIECKLLLHSGRPRASAEPLQARGFYPSAIQGHLSFDLSSFSAISIRWFWWLSLTNSMRNLALRRSQRYRHSTLRFHFHCLTMGHRQLPFTTCKEKHHRIGPHLLSLDSSILSPSVPLGL